MFDIFNTWSRLMASAMAMGQTGLRAAETMGAAQQVIAARTPMINAAILSPLSGDHKELSRMVPEKVEAFSRAGSATVSAWWAAQAVWMAHMQHLGVMAMRGRAATPAELIDLGDRSTALTLQSIEAAARLGGRALAPVHSKATANARRLSRRAPASPLLPDAQRNRG